MIKDIKFICNHCAQSLEAAPEYAGEIINCPSCERQIQIPKAKIIVTRKLEVSGKQFPNGTAVRSKFELRGWGSYLGVYTDKVILRPEGAFGLLTQGLKGTKTIPFHSITSIQFRKADGLLAGYLQFGVLGGIESRGGLLAAGNDENSFMFQKPSLNAKAAEVKAYIETRINEIRAPAPVVTPQVSVADELGKLAILRQEGLISPEEFAQAKASLLKQG